MKHRILITILVPAGFAMALAFEIYAAPELTTLRPGQFHEINQNLAVNIVFVGYEQGTGPRDINEANFRAGLPSRYRAMVISPSLYIPSNEEDRSDLEREVVRLQLQPGLREPVFRRRIFQLSLNEQHSLRQLDFQDHYNTQQTRSLDVSANICIGATMAEKWLAINARADAGRGHGQIHDLLYQLVRALRFSISYLRAVMTHPDPDPDTGMLGLTEDLINMIAWGGTTPDDDQNGLGSLRRVWFYDLSAGPEYNTSNCILDPDEASPS